MCIGVPAKWGQPQNTTRERVSSNTTIVVLGTGPPKRAQIFFTAGLGLSGATQHQDVFLVLRVSVCTSNSRHMNMAGNVLFIIIIFDRGKKKNDYEGVALAMALQGEGSYSSLESQLSGLRLVHRVDWAASNSL